MTSPMSGRRMGEWFKSGYQERLARLNLLFLAAFALVVIVLGYWGAVRVNFLAGREDNPRTVEAELRIQRGRILDANEIVLAQNVGTPARQERTYPLPIAEPALGYYSLRFGTAGVEQALDPLLRGETDESSELFAREVLNAPAVGQDVRLTLNSELQANAVRLMDGQQGAAVLLSLPDGAVRAMVSLPTFDPNTLDEQFDQLAADESAPLLNRATQGLYQPGLILQPFLLAAALDSGTNRLQLTDLPQSLTPEEEVRLTELLAERWSAADLTAAWERFGFLEAPAVSLPVAAAQQPAIGDLAAALRGEESLIVTPLQVALATAALGLDGVLPDPQIISGVRQDGRWQAYAGRPESAARQAVSPQAAAAIGALLAEDGAVREYATTVLAGPDMLNSWYIGLAPGGAPRYVVVVVLEGTGDLEEIQVIGRRLLALALN